MYPRTKYEMTEEDLTKLLEACRSVPCIVVGGCEPPTPQENANRAWKALGVQMGFDWQTVRPIEGMGSRFFTAVPNETEAQKDARLKREAAEKRLTRITELKQKISTFENELIGLNRELEGQLGINLDTKLDAVLGVE